MREQHFDNVATNSFLPIGVEHDLSARILQALFEVDWSVAALFQ